jgi:hypothetical protein
VAQEKPHRTFAAHEAWFYHVKGEEGTEGAGQVYPETHDVTLAPTADWCVTHRPQSPCTCGQYTLEWQ